MSPVIRLEQISLLSGEKILISCTYRVDKAFDHRVFFLLLYSAIYGAIAQYLLH